MPFPGYELFKTKYNILPKRFVGIGGWSLEPMLWKRFNATISSLFYDAKAWARRRFDDIGLVLISVTNREQINPTLADLKLSEKQFRVFKNFVKKSSNFWRKTRSERNDIFPGKDTRSKYFIKQFLIYFSLVEIRINVLAESIFGVTK